MKIAEFVSLIAQQEGKKVETTVGNIREVLSLTNKATKGELYKFIKTLKKEEV